MDFLPNTHRQLQELLDETTDFNGPIDLKKTSTESIRSAAARPRETPTLAGPGKPMTGWCQVTVLINVLQQTQHRIFPGVTNQSSWGQSWSICWSQAFFRVVWVVFHVGQTRKKTLGTTARCAKAASTAKTAGSRHEFFKGIIHFFVLLPSNWECQPTKVDPWNILGVPRFWIGSGCFGDPSKQLHHWFMILSKHQLCPLQTMLSQRHVNGPSAIASTQRKRHQSVFLGTWSTPPSENQCIHAFVAEVNHLA